MRDKRADSRQVALGLVGVLGDELVEPPRAPVVGVGDGEPPGNREVALLCAGHADHVRDDVVRIGLERSGDLGGRPFAGLIAQQCTHRVDLAIAEQALRDGEVPQRDLVAMDLEITGLEPAIEAGVELVRWKIPG